MCDIFLLYLSVKCRVCIRGDLSLSTINLLDWLNKAKEENICLALIFNHILRNHGEGEARALSHFFQWEAHNVVFVSSLFRA